MKKFHEKRQQNFPLFYAQDMCITKLSVFSSAKVVGASI